MIPGHVYQICIPIGLYFLGNVSQIHRDMDPVKFIVECLVGEFEMIGELSDIGTYVDR